MASFRGRIIEVDMSIRSSYSRTSHCRLRIEQEIKEIERITGNKLTKEDLLDHLFGDRENYPATELNFMVLDTVETEFKHRVAALLILPIWFITVPFNWLVNGRTGWAFDSRFSRWAAKKMGYFHDD